MLGNTPIRRCPCLSSHFNTNIFIKEEFYNYGKSAKGRPAFFMIQEAITHNRIRPGGTFVEASSGNTGLAIAMLAKKMGYKSKIFISKNCSDEKIDLLIAAGAQIEICENSNGLKDFNSTQFRAQSFAANQSNAYFTDQYYNPENIRAHYETTGPEIWAQTGGRLTHFIAGIGTGGTISGVGRYLKQKSTKIKIWGIEPIGSILSHFLLHQKIPSDIEAFEAIEGIGRSFVPGTFDPSAVDLIYQVGREDAIAAGHTYAEETGIFAGFSSAAILAGLQKSLQLNPFLEDDCVVLLFPDHGDRYMSKLYAKTINK